MTTLDEYKAMDWWAEGDTPVHDDSCVVYFTDGRLAMYSMCIHFLKARRYIHVANWGFTPQIELVRGKDQRVGPDGSPEQEQLIARLREEGLDEDAIDFWRRHRLSAQAVLGYAASKGVDVRVLLWECPPIFSHYTPIEAGKELTEVGITCLLDDSSSSIAHISESLHQKISIVDNDTAFVGGIDLLIEQEGDFDRWDMASHLFASPLRETTQEKPPHPWHDAHSRINGPAVADVELNFRQRWNDAVERKNLDRSLLLSDETPPPPLPPEMRTGLVQVARTIPKGTYNFAPEGIHGIAEMYAKAFSNAQRFIYLENQYLWLRAYSGLDISLIGMDSPQMERNLHELIQALQRGVSVAIVLPDHPNVGRAFTDTGLKHLYENAPEAFKEGRLCAFTLGTFAVMDDGIHYRPVYVHAKVGIVDDVWTTVGSGNLNNRGMRDDAEMNVASLDPQHAFRLRLLLWAEHLGLLDADEIFDLAYYYRHPQAGGRGEDIWNKIVQTFGDPTVGLHLMAQQAQENLQRCKDKQPLVGHLLPYLTAEEAREEGVNFREGIGWLEE